MAEINQPDNITSINQHLPDRNKHESKKKNPYAESAKKEMQAPREVGEVASILGISPGAINNEIRHAVSALLNQMDWLRRQHEEVTHRKNYLEEIADIHSRVDELNRHAVLRELNRRMEHATRVGLEGAAALVHIPGLDDIRLQYGLDVADRLLQQICNDILGVCRTGDVIGLVSDQDIMLVLPLKTRPEADETVRRICKHVRDRDYVDNDIFFTFELFYSVCSYVGEKHATAVLDKLDRALLSAIRNANNVDNAPENPNSGELL